MSKKAIMLFTLFLLFVTIESIDDSAKLIEYLKNSVNSLNKTLPSSHTSLINNFMGITDLISDSFEKNNPEILKNKYPFIPNEVLDRFKGLRFTDTVTVNKFDDFIQKTDGRGILYIGTAVWDGFKVKFAYIQSDMHGDLKEKQECHQEYHYKRALGFLWKTKEWYETVCNPVGYNQNDIMIIRDSLEYKSLSQVKNRLSNTNSNSEFVMSQSVELNSLTGNSICKIMENGQLFIGNKKYSNSISDAKKFAKLLGLPQKTANAPFTLELSVTKEQSNEFVPNIKIYDENGDLSEISQDEIRIDEFENSHYQNELIEITKIEVYDKNRKTFFSLKAPIGVRPYRLTMLENNVLLLSDYQWTPIYDSARLYTNKVDVLIPQGYKIYSENNKYYAFLSNSGRLGLYKASISGKTDQIIWSVDKYDDIEGPYNLVVEKSGEIRIVNFATIETWKSETIGVKRGSKKLIVTNDGAIQTVDIIQNKVIFDSTTYVYPYEQ